MHADPLALGQRIAGLRRAQGWSQRRLAEAAGVSHGYVALLELGRLPSPGNSTRRRRARPEPAPQTRCSSAVGGHRSRLACCRRRQRCGRTSTRCARSGLAATCLSAGLVRRSATARFADPDHLEFPPPGRETLIGPAGFGVWSKAEHGRARHLRRPMWCGESPAPPTNSAKWCSPWSPT